MRNASPLRYPGGKSVLADLLSGIRKINGFGNLSIAEPFAGGAGASISLLRYEETPDIYINDADSTIYDFWWSIINNQHAFQKLLMKTPINITEWNRQINIYRNNKESHLKRGFATFYLNRCNRSGIIINSGPIGGKRQTGRWKISARFNRSELSNRIAKLSEYKDRIYISALDGINFIQEKIKENLFYFIDPPYFEKGKTLYLNSLNFDYHIELCKILKSIEGIPWILTYDDCPQIRKLYKNWAKIRPFSIRYSASTNSMGRELLIAPIWISLPKYQSSEALLW